MSAILNYTMLPYTMLHYTILPYPTLPYTTLPYTILGGGGGCRERPMAAPWCLQYGTLMEDYYCDEARYSPYPYPYPYPKDDCDCDDAGQRRPALQPRLPR